jgi:hypothetical protein
MMMRFRGGGVGHKAFRKATDTFLRDRDPLDLVPRAAPIEGHVDKEVDVGMNVNDEEHMANIDEDLENDGGGDGDDDGSDSENSRGHGENKSSEEEYYGSDKDGKELDSNELGAEDGEGEEKEYELLRYGNL